MARKGDGQVAPLRRRPWNPDAAPHPPHPAAVPMKRVAMLVITLAVSAGMVVYAFWEVDLAELAAILGRGDYRILPPFLALLVGFYGVTAVAWKIILRPVGHFRLQQLIPSMMMGFGGNNVLPAHMGELVRVVVFSLRYRKARSTVITTLFVERIFDGFAILLLFFIAALSLEHYPESLEITLRATAAIFGVICIGVLIFVRYPLLFLRAWEIAGRPFSERVRASGARMLAGCEAGFATLKSPADLAFIVSLATVKWSIQATMVWLSLYAFGASVEPGLSALVVAVAALAVALPSAPGFFGVMQAAFVFTLIPFGITREVALAASVLYLMAQWIPVTLIGMFFFLTQGLGVGRLAHEVAHEGEEGA